MYKVGDKVKINSQLEGTVLRVSDSHGLCYEVELPKRDYNHRRIVFLDSDELEPEFDWMKNITENADPQKDWIEDFDYDNGCYHNMCVQCNNGFLGHKRRILCRKCANDKLR